MKPRTFGILVLTLLFLLGAVMVLSGSGDGAGGSSLSAAPGGLLAARLYLESRGAEVALLKTPPSAAELAGKALLLAAPFQRPCDAKALAAVRDHLRQGGQVVYAYAGGFAEGAEKALREELGLDPPESLRPDPPLSPLAWRRFRGETFVAAPEPESPLGRPIEVLAFERAPRPPAAALVHFRAGQGLAPIVFEYPLQRGQVLVLPAALLSNAELRRAGNADLLELMLGKTPAGIGVDEMRHGLYQVEVASHGARLGWNLFLLQAALLYLAALWALGRSFGPAWRERIPTYGSAGAFFEQLGALHHQLRHHQGAARALIERARALDPNLPAELASRTIHHSNDFLDLAREVALHQHPRRSKT